MLAKLGTLLGYLNPRISVGREAGADLFGWYNVVYVRVRGFTLHLGITRETN